MTIKGTKFRHLILGLQLFAGFGLLTASYVTTDKDWTTQLVQAAINSQQTTNKGGIDILKAGRRC